MAAGFSFDSLNRAQRDAVATLDGPVLILAGAGTGKTRTVTCRISNMLEVGIAPENVLAVTFTNKAAAEMRERIGGMVGKKKAEAMTVCTFHSLCVRLLRGGIDRLGYKKNFSICTQSDQVGVMKQLIVRKGGKEEKLKAEEVLAAVSKAKNSGIPLERMKDDFFAQLAVAYDNELRVRNAVDFDDLLLLAEKLLREHSDVRDHFRQVYRRVTVDEFQDTNGLQMQLLQQLVGKPYHVCVVGDDDQSIYGWRGAESANILEFERFFPDPTVIRLEENYRSTEAILHTANSLIRHNAGRREKMLRHTMAGGEPVRLIGMPGDDEEAEFIAEEILALKATEKRPWEDFAILFRTNMQSRKLEEALRKSQVPYRMVGAQSFYDRREIKDVLAYLEILDDPRADVPLLRILNAPPRGIGQATTLMATDFSRERQVSVWEAMCDPEFTDLLATKARNAIGEFLALVMTAKAMIDGKVEPANKVLSDFLDTCGYRDWLERGCKTPKEVEQRMESIHELLQEVSKYVQRGKSIRKFLDDSALASDREDDDLDKKSGATLITLHASKGLEFPVVYLVGMEEGVLPHRRSLEEGTKDEERRLLYVGITRAQKKLTMTYCQARTKWGQQVGCTPSTFIVEIDEKHLIHTCWDDIMGAEVDEEELDDFFGEMEDFLKS
ncbi:superfamily I DNA/RNA helicase [Haloferula luteola]|uniref:DNA 3'-5' helicase n=1 Tax=Haloferula luteola TaxID=595692 RepID=A0A840V9B2_9BACT|nr:UvrD-helicase domain-containing protein [Haloferula luteola]MBB5353656.1 superfamily I DNA/RNA helicase [Haloferula luteola]